MVLLADGRFVMTSLHHAPGARPATIKGTWIESKNDLRLNGETGSAGNFPPHKIVFTTLVKGKNLIEGTADAFGVKEPADFTLTWSAVRTG
jgi:hypothetical protein